MENTKIREEQELDLRQKLVNNLLERQKLVAEAKERSAIVRVISQEVLIQRRHDRLAKEMNQLHKKYENILND